MKRGYKPGDWFAVPLEERKAIVGLITQQSGSRLGGYFFAAASAAPSFSELKNMNARDACLYTAFAASPIEELRWPIIATSLAFDPIRWKGPEPLFSYAAAAGEVEDALRERLELARAPLPLRVYEAKPPFDASFAVPRGYQRVQIARALSQHDAVVLARSFKQSGASELRLHGMHGAPFDLRTLGAWADLRALIIDTHNIAHPQALADARTLQQLALRDADRLLPYAAQLPQLRSLAISGSLDCASLAHCAHLETLVLAGGADLHIGGLRHLPLRSLTLAHEPRDLGSLRELTHLEYLELRDMQLAALPDLAGSRALRTLVLSDVRLLRDLHELLRAPALRRAVLRTMPQLRPPDTAPLREIAGRVKFEFDTGNRTIDRELYRSLQLER